MHHCLLTALALILGSSFAQAQSEIVEYTEDPCQNRTWTGITIPSMGDIAITGITDSWTAIRVRTSSGTSAIRRLVLSGQRLGSVPLEVYVAGIACLPPDPAELVAEAGTTWAGLTFASDTDSHAMRQKVVLTAAISDDLTGSIDVGTIYRLQVGDAIIAPVVATGEDGTGIPAIHVIAAGNILHDDDTQFGSITAVAGEIGTIAVGTPAQPGQLTGPIVVSGTTNTPGIELLDVKGSINIAASPGISVAVGSIESVRSTGPITLTSPARIEVLMNIESIIAMSTSDVPQDITAEIEVGNDLIEMICDDFTGSLNATKLALPTGEDFRVPGIHVQGDVDAPLVFSGTVERSIRVDGAFLAGSRLETGTLSASVIAGGDITEIVAGVVQWPNTIDDALVIRSVTGNIGRIEVAGPVYADTSRSDYEVLIIADGDIGEITAGNYEPGGTLFGFGAMVQCDHLGTLMVRGSMLADMTVASFDQITVTGAWGLDQGTGDEVLIRGNGGITIGGESEFRTSIYHELHFDGYGGQVILNANGYVNGLWNLPAFYGGIGGAGELETTPYYDDADAFDGSVGLVPFHLNDTQCEPPLDSAIGARTFLNSAFCHRSTVSPWKSVVLHMYGPVLPESNIGFSVFREVSPGVPGTVDYAPYMNVEYAPDGIKRLIMIHGQDFAQLSPGVYHIRPHLTGEDRMLCDELITEDEIPVGEDFDYVFVLEGDCNANGIEDVAEIGLFPLRDVWPENDVLDCCEICQIDVNDDGNIDQDDVSCIKNVVTGNPGCEGVDPDVNFDGNVDQDDVAAVINATAGGPCCF